ncbi:hypothetical protein M1247_09215 [Mycobacterium sp. 21AC1]|uniref:LGFP repeat-containing protein n=1 Tax=[Mycobacterium] appelbergii TaxID=2939269 RepID=UPI0029391E09|nr:hypothetical protein [Mycobacterium sp. 21AC1]MDV3125085.1 hypothetical protein [Mycobacterium sp. 21AC1]
MTRPGARLNTVVRRMTVGLLAVAVTGLLAPVAAATPESDADAAVTAAWDASGGDGGPLGPRQGDVYAAGPGFVQDFAGGKMFFTAATGAHYMQGAILEKYEAQGGPEGDLGFPTIDEGAGLAPDSRNSTLSGPDNPVIFWTPATGARVVRGAINAAWDKLGGSSGVLGVPSEDEAYRGDAISQKFTGGEVSWNRKTKAFTTVPPELADQLAGLAVPDDPASAIAAASRAAGGDMGPLGAKDGDQYPIGNTGGIGQNYARGKVFYTPDTGANAITGQLLDKYESVGGPEGDLGFPISGETDGGFGQNSRVATFAAADKPVIFLTPDYGAVIVRGAMNAAWDKLGGAQGELGAPMADQTEDGTVITQRFSGGAISWDRSDNTFTTEPSNLSSELAGLQVPGLDQPPAPGGPQAADTDDTKPFSWHWNWWWLLALIPVLLLAGLIVGAALWHRRRGRDDDEFDHDPFDDDQYGGYDEGRYDQGHQEDRPYDEGQYTERSGIDSPDPYQPAADYESGDAATSRFTDSYHQTQGASPFDGPTDIAMPVSQWASPAGAGMATHDPEDDDEEAGELSSARGRSDAEFATEFDDEFDDDQIDDADYLDAPDQVDVEADLDDDDEVEAELETPQQGLGFAAADFDDPDNVDTAPTRIEALPRYETDTETHSGRHAAIEFDEPVPSATAIHLPLEDPHRAPEGYPIKADTKSGQYWSPDSAEYDDAVAEIWFASEEFARTNGFVRAD